LSQVILDKRVEKSLNRLKAMGLKVYVEAPSKNEAYIVIDMQSVVNMIYNKITYPNKEIHLEDKYMIIRIWKEV